METDNKAFTEAQKELIMAHEQLGAVHRSINLAKTSLHKNEITKVELGKLEDHRVFKSVGRMFVLSDKESLIKSIEDQNSIINTETVKFQNLKKTYEIKKESATKQLQEMIKT
mmetsp:Transcript_20874/g.23216  ORF Transcript_20874/g.23216 Transcript_20874/m.23216 type:complete len:113 (+) Transcript_20874:19-357(+)